MNVEANEEIGARLREARERKGWTISHLARVTQISKSHLSDTENGKRNPSASTLTALCRALEVSADWVMGMSAGPLPKEQSAIEKVLREVLLENAALRIWKKKASHKLALLVDGLEIDLEAARKDVL